jgi:hypothetical protein
LPFVTAMSSWYSEASNFWRTGLSVFWRLIRSQLFWLQIVAEASGSRTHHRYREITIAGFEDRDDHRTACASVLPTRVLPFHGSRPPGGCIGLAGGLGNGKVFHVERFVLAEVYGQECTDFGSK